jgi:hypothetical protein
MKQKNLYLGIIITLLITLSAYVTAVQVTGQSSSYTFTVENCTSPQINETINCSPATIKYICDFYNPAFINSVNFRIEGSNYLTTQNSTNPNQFYYTYYKPAEGNTNLDDITFDRQTITDVDGQSVNSYETVFINHNCTTCPANTTRNVLEPCQTDNTQQVEYISSNETCLPTYNTTESCNYCNANIYQNITDCDLITGTRNITYFDMNYTTCCLTTGLTEDCLILQNPYNTTTTQNCDYYANEINCTIDEKPILNPKININCVMPNNEEYCCVINTYQGTSLLATSPEYKETSQSIISLSGQQETRTCFTPTNKLLNAYYTTKELRPKIDFIIEVLCTSNNSTLRTQKLITPVYHTEDWLTARINWFGDNPMTLIMTGAVIIAGIFLLIFIIKKARGR